MEEKYGRSGDIRNQAPSKLLVAYIAGIIYFANSFNVNIKLSYKVNNHVTISNLKEALRIKVESFSFS